MRLTPLFIAATSLVLLALVGADPVNVNVQVSPQISSGCCGGSDAGNASCPCVDEIRALADSLRTPRDPTLGPDFDHDANWRFIGMANFMNDQEMRRLPFATFDNDQNPTTPYTLERERPIAVSPEGRMYMWLGAITDFGDLIDGPSPSHLGDERPAFTPRPLPNEDRGNCIDLDSLTPGRSTVAGDGIVLQTLPGARIVSAPFTAVGGTQTTFPTGGLEVGDDGTLSIRGAVRIEWTNAKTKAVMLNGLRQLGSASASIVNLGINDDYLHAGAFPSIAAPPFATGYEVHEIDAAAGRYVILATNPNSTLGSILLGNFAVSDVCLFDSIQDEWYAAPLLYLPSLPRERSVIGSDSRDRYNPTNYFPVRALGAIHSPNGDTHYCSGSKVGPRHFLTAGHCMFDKDTKKWIPNARIWFGQNGDGSGMPPSASQAPYGIKKHSWYYSVVGWFEDLDWRYDYGMIVLKDEPQTVSLGWLGYASDWTMSLAGNTVNLIGHPGSDKFCQASPKANKQCGGFMYGDSGAIWFQFPYHLYYKIDTNPGNSGSAVYYYSGGHRYVVGIHAYGDFGDALNKAVRIRGAVYDNIKSWISHWPSAFD